LNLKFIGGFNEAIKRWLARKLNDNSIRCEQNNKPKITQQIKNLKIKTIQAQSFKESKNLKQTLDSESSKRCWWTLKTLSICTKVKMFELST
jgi:hypothetical protein